ncbi:MAG: hypothetical protein ABSE62_06105 [Chthoniobacteraceae bacterium]
MRARTFCFLIASVLLATGVSLRAQSPYESSEDFARYAMKLREAALLKIEPEVYVPTTSSRSSLWGFGSNYPWKAGIVTTVFWVGERPTENNPVPNTRSAWDPDWVDNYGGYDDPDPNNRRNYIPANFTPRQNPFYCALPYNDVSEGSTKPEAPLVIPWFKEAYVKYGQSVCQNRWIEIRNHDGRSCYAQWSDCGPFRTDDYQYVFGNEVPEPNLNHGAGLDVSPAVRDFLDLSGMDVTSWRFVDFHDVPPGPWSYFGDNNDFVVNARKNTERVVSRNPGDDDGNSPTVITR